MQWVSPLPTCFQPSIAAPTRTTSATSTLPEGWCRARERAFGSRVTVSVRHAQASDRVALEIEFDQHHRLAADDPAVMSRLDRDDLRRLVFDDAAVGVFDVNLAARQEADVCVHAEVGAGHRFHVA